MHEQISCSDAQAPHRHTDEARAVERGTKYAANFWIHLYDFQVSTRKLVK